MCRCEPRLHADRDTTSLLEQRKRDPQRDDMPSNTTMQKKSSVALLRSWIRILHHDIFGGAGRSRTGLEGFAVPCITALLPRHKQQATGETNQSDATH